LFTVLYKDRFDSVAGASHCHKKTRNGLGHHRNLDSVMREMKIHIFVAVARKNDQQLTSV